MGFTLLVDMLQILGTRELERSVLSYRNQSIDLTDFRKILKNTCSYYKKKSTFVPSTKQSHVSSD